MEKHHEKGHVKEEPKPSGKPGKPEKLDERTERNLHYSIAEGTVGNVDMTIRNSYTTPFALSLNATSAEIGLMTSAQHLASTIAQIPASRLHIWVGGKKRGWIFSHIIQKIFWIPIMLLPFLIASNQVFALIVLLACTSFFGGMRTPSWSALMGDVVPKGKWGKFFGRRNMYMNIAGLATALACGQLLIWMGFPFILTAAFVFGLFSIYFFSKIYEPPCRHEYHYTHTVSVNFSGLWKSVKINRNFAFFTLFMTAINFAVFFASPFFAVYMLSDLKIGYLWYAALAVIESIAIIVSQPYWGNLCDKFGDRNIMIITGILVAFVPFYWIFITNPYEIIIADALSGFAWAGFGIATFNFMLASSPADKRAEFTASHSFFTGLGVVGGAFCGGMAAHLFQGSAFLWMVGLQVVFLISFFLRLTSLFFLSLLKEPRVKETKESVGELFWLLVAVNPIKRIIHVRMHPYDMSWRKWISMLIKAAKNKIIYKFIMWREK